MTDQKDRAPADQAEIDIENIIFEKNLEKKTKTEKEMSKAASRFKSLNSFINQAFRGLIGLLDATTTVLESLGNSVAIVGFVFLLLGEATRSISTLLDPTTSTSIKVLSLLALLALIPLVVVGIAYGGLTMAAISIGVLGYSTVKKSSKLGENLANYFSLTAKLEKPNSSIVIEDKKSSSEKLELLYQERERIIKNYTNKLILLKTFPRLQAEIAEDGVQNLAQTHRKALMQIDQRIEEISHPEKHIQKQLSQTKKEIINTSADLLLLAGSLALILIAVPSLIAGAPVLIPAAVGLGITIGVIGICKIAANWTIGYLEKAAEKEKKQEKKGEIQQEVLKSYQNESQPQCTTAQSATPPAGAAPAAAASDPSRNNEEPKENHMRYAS